MRRRHLSKQLRHEPCRRSFETFLLSVKHASLPWITYVFIARMFLIASFVQKVFCSAYSKASRRSLFRVVASLATLTALIRCHDRAMSTVGKSYSFSSG